MLVEPSAAPIATIGDLFGHLFKSREQTLRPTTIERDRYHLALWRRELGERSVLVTLNEAAITRARAQIATATSAGTANDGFNIVKTYLTWAFNQGLLSTQFFKSIRKLKVPPKERNERAWWTATEVEFALSCAREDAQTATAVLYVAIGCFLGLRPEEAIMLRWQDIELDAIDPLTKARCPVAHITPHDEWTPKDGEARAIPICDRLYDILCDFRRPSGYLLEATVVRTKRKPNAPWAYRYDPKKVWKRVNERIVAAGGKAITAYGMRHSFASNLLIANVPDFKVSKWLGHADARMLHRHYGHLRSYDRDINAGSAATRPSQSSTRTGA
ncbi:MAG: tyrosine-type recombinase/integrase [Planctomycetes bacterium]|nr:tyrosine-type recombinase/integrase [Planctomycetota bacterium]